MAFLWSFIMFFICHTLANIFENSLYGCYRESKCSSPAKSYINKCLCIALVCVTIYAIILAIALCVEPFANDIAAILIGNGIGFITGSIHFKIMADQNYMKHKNNKPNTTSVHNSRDSNNQNEKVDQQLTKNFNQPVTQASLCGRMNAIILRLRLNGGAELVDDPSKNEACNFLFDFYKTMKHHPPAQLMLNIYAVAAENLDEDLPAIVYVLYFSSEMTACPIYIFLVKTDHDKIRFFTIEMGSPLALCEYSDSKHILHCFLTDLETVPDKIREIIYPTKNQNKTVAPNQNFGNYEFKDYSLDGFMEYIKSNDVGDIEFFRKCLLDVLSIENISFNQLITDMDELNNKFYSSNFKPTQRSINDLRNFINFFYSYVIEVRLKRATISDFKSFLEEKSNENSNISLQDKDLNTYLDDLFSSNFFEYKPKLELNSEIINHLVNNLTEVLLKENKTLYWLSTHISSRFGGELEVWLEKYANFENPSLRDSLEWYLAYCQHIKKQL